MLADQAVQISVSAEQLTGEIVRAVLQRYIFRLRFPKENAVHGEQSLEDLNAQNRELKRELIDQENLEPIRRELKRYAVDFHVMKDPDGGPYQLFFKAQDVERVHEGLQRYVKDLGKPPMEEQVKDAAKEADARNAAHDAAKEVEQVMKKAVEKEAEL